MFLDLRMWERKFSEAKSVEELTNCSKELAKDLKIFKLNHATISNLLEMMQTTENAGVIIPLALVELIISDKAEVAIEVLKITLQFEGSAIGLSSVYIDKSMAIKFRAAIDERAYDDAAKIMEYLTEVGEIKGQPRLVKHALATLDGMREHTKNNKEFHEYAKERIRILEQECKKLDIDSVTEVELTGVELNEDELEEVDREVEAVFVTGSTAEPWELTPGDLEHSFEVEVATALPRIDIEVGGSGNTTLNTLGATAFAPPPEVEDGGCPHCVII
jgi:hypothetical protein